MFHLDQLVSPHSHVFKILTPWQLLLSPPQGLSSNPQPGNSVCLHFFCPAIDFQHLHSTKSFRLRSKVCSTKAGLCENLLVLKQLDLRIQTLALQYILTDRTSIVSHLGEEEARQLGSSSPRYDP